ncbi:hypothetical protein RND81_07G174900 [Saponaria officinalis]|uniref:J domain-containing protein n=1 Tax=Saponaria officinalis TaxID=3572 RepID=A0AAW1JPJ5_SAPOF
MSAAEACPGHFLPKKCFGKRGLRECGSRKRDNVVLIEVDSDDFGDVIILDVPESFHKKFRKKPKHVISIDDDDDDDNAGESRSEACDTNGDATTSDKYSPTSFSPSNSADVDQDSIHEVNTPFNLSKSKRTYSSKNDSRNRYSFGSDDNYLSDSDCSDCEFVGESFGGLKDQWKKPSFMQPHYRSRDFPENKAGSSASYEPAYNTTEEVISENLKPPGQQSNSSNLDTDDAVADFAKKFAEESWFFQQDFNPNVMGEQFQRKQDSCSNNSDSNNKLDPSTLHCPLFQSDRQNTVGVSEPSTSGRCSNKNIKEPFNDSTKEPAGRCDFSRQDGDAMEIDEVFWGENFADINESSNLSGETNCPASSERDLRAEQPSTLSEDDPCSGNQAHDDKVNSSDDHSRIIIDRQKLQETDEYKRIWEEEYASRRHQLELQAEEARRLRNRKKAENMRIKANERRQMERLEEIRETRRKDEESSNLKDQLRAAIRNELRQLERTCGDMSSLLRCLGIPVGGLYPSAKEIQAAYKRACLKFHPDRYAKSDLRQQVEAEEKFKLISNMKDKLQFK